MFHDSKYSNTNENTEITQLEDIQHINMDQTEINALVKLKPQPPDPPGECGELNILTMLNFGNFPATGGILTVKVTAPISPVLYKFSWLGKWEALNYKIFTTC